MRVYCTLKTKFLNNSEVVKITKHKMIKETTKETLREYAVTLIASLTSMGMGCSMTWTSPGLTYLTSEESYLPTTKDQGSWIASLLTIGFIFGYLLNPPLNHKTNRKTSLIIFGLAQALSWLLIVLAKSMIVIYTARIIQGIGYGGGICSTTAYISEIGNRNSRGLFISIMKCFISLGGAIIIILGASVSYQKMNLVLLIIPIIYITLFVFLPDSSYFLEMNKKKEQGKQEEEMEVRMKLNHLKEEVERGQKLNLKAMNQDLRIETKYITSNLEKSNFKTRTLNIRKTKLWMLFALPNNRRAMLIIASLTCIVIFSGCMGLSAFTEQIFTYEGSFLPPKTAAVVLKSASVVASVSGVFFVERVKRRSLLLYSGMILAVSNAFFGLFFFLKENSVDVSFIEWLPIVAFIIFDLSFTVGIGALFFIYQGELLAIEIKNEGITCVKMLYMIMVFFFLLNFQTLMSALGYYMMYGLFALGTGLTTYVTYIMVPESKGKSFDEIQILLMPSSGNVKRILLE